MRLLAVAVVVAAVAFPVALAGDMVVEVEDPQGGAPFYIVLGGVEESLATTDPNAGPESVAENATAAADYAMASQAEGGFGPSVWEETNGVPGLQREAVEVDGRIVALADARLV